MKPELLPCPFCEKDDELKITHIYEGEAYIGCDRCKYDGVHIAVWNTRELNPCPFFIEEALERRRPKPPAMHLTYSKVEAPHCPQCDVQVKEYLKYCWNCGQKLDWSEYEIC